MTRKVRLTDYNQRIEVPQGAALFLEGGDIVVDGEIGSEGDSLGIVGGKPGYAPGGGGGGFSPTITDPQDGDIIARVGGVWVNSGNLKIGANIVSYDEATPDNDIAFLALDPANIDHAGESWRVGIGLATAVDTPDAWVIQTRGRYQLTAMVAIFQDPTAWLVMRVMPVFSAKKGDFTPGVAAIPPASVIASNPQVAIFAGPPLELDVGATVSWAVIIQGAVSNVYSAILGIQYVGPATSL